MKKILMSLGLVLALSGCVFDRDELYQEMKPYLTHKEEVLFDAYYRHGHTGDYIHTLTAVKLNRRLATTGSSSREGWVTVSDKAPPFCDEILALRLDESNYTEGSVHQRHSILTMYEDSQGETLQRACDRYNGIMPEDVSAEGKVGSIDVQEVSPKDAIPKEDITEVTGNTTLSASKYRELTVAVKGCNIAKVKLIGIISERYLTDKDHKTISRLILDCEVDNMRNELNKS